MSNTDQNGIELNEFVSEGAEISNEEIEPRRSQAQIEIENEKLQSWFPHEKNLQTIMFKLMDDPASSRISFTINVLIIILIVISCISFVTCSMQRFKFPTYGEQEGDIAPVFEWIEVVCISCFTVEYVLRLICSAGVSWTVLLEAEAPCSESNSEFPFTNIKKVIYFITRGFNLIDLLAIAPFYLSLMSQSGASSSSFSVLRILRLFRVFRIFKLGRYSREALVYLNVVHEATLALSLMFFFATLMAIVFGSLVYYVERGIYDEQAGEFLRWNFDHTEKVKSPFTSIPISMWWAFVTQTTVGYGDIYPTSAVGRILCIITMNLGKTYREI